MRFEQLKPIVSLIDYSSAFTLIYTGFLGIVQYFDDININPGVYMAAAGGLVWAFARSFVHVRESISKTRQAAHDLEMQKRRETAEIKRMEMEIRIEASKRLFSAPAILEKKEYEIATKTFDKYRADMEALIEGQRRKNDLRAKK